MAPSAPAVPAEAPNRNDLTDFPDPKTGGDLLSSGVLLIKSVDLAVQRSLTAEQIVSQVLEPFEDAVPTLMSMVSGMDAEQLNEFIVGHVPSDWAILSPRGEELVAKAFELWQSAADDGGV